VCCLVSGLVCVLFSVGVGVRVGMLSHVVFKCFGVEFVCVTFCELLFGLYGEGLFAVVLLSHFVDVWCVAIGGVICCVLVCVFATYCLVLL